MGDAAAALHARRLDDDQAGAGQGELRLMLPVSDRIGAAIVGAVLAHRRDDDAVGQFERPEPQGREQSCGHGDDWPSVVGERSLEVGVAIAFR
jgi:hypothetical protein